MCICGLLRVCVWVCHHECVCDCEGFDSVLECAFVCLAVCVGLLVRLRVIYVYTHLATYMCVMMRVAAPSCDRTSGNLKSLSPHLLYGAHHRCALCCALSCASCSTWSTCYLQQVRIAGQKLDLAWKVHILYANNMPSTTCG